MSDLLTALVPVIQTLEDLGVRYYIAGSVASSAHGMARASLDVDLVADLEAGQIEALVWPPWELQRPDPPCDLQGRLGSVL